MGTPAVHPLKTLPASLAKEMRMRKCLPTGTVILGLLMLVAPAALADYRVQWQALEAGHVTVQWAVNGAFPATTPCIDADLQASQSELGSTPDAAANGTHEWWTDAGGGAAETSVVCGYPPPTPSFAETLAPYGTTVTWLSLADAEGLRDAFVDIMLPDWAAFLQANPLPNTSAIYLFDDYGYCAALPGYYAMDAVTGATFSGPMKVVGTGTLTVPEPTAMALLGAGVAMLVRRKR